MADLVAAFRRILMTSDQRFCLLPCLPRASAREEKPPGGWDIRLAARLSRDGWPCAVLRSGVLVDTWGQRVTDG